jgi:hypothetical protein
MGVFVTSALSDQVTGTRGLFFVYLSFLEMSCVSTHKPLDPNAPTFPSLTHSSLLTRLIARQARNPHG